MHRREARTRCRTAFVLGLALGFQMTDADIAAARSVQDVLSRLGPRARARLLPSFNGAGVAYPPKRLALLAFKEERRLEVWAGGAPHAVFIRDYPVLAASGGPGPKLVQGDGQVPEGIHRVLWLNPNSRFHLSMKLDYPNAFDRRMAVSDGRTELGGDIFIHGNAVSIGCLAMGDEAIEELFVLAADTGVENVRVVIVPKDLRKGEETSRSAPWASELYRRLGAELRGFRR
jgi:murein L,D-transpeptidase YafK